MPKFDLILAKDKEQAKKMIEVGLLRKDGTIICKDTGEIIKKGTVYNIKHLEVENK